MTSFQDTFCRMFRVGTLDWFDEYRDAGRSQIAVWVYILNRGVLGILLTLVMGVIGEIAVNIGVSTTVAGPSILLIVLGAIGFEVTRMMRLGAYVRNQNANDGIQSK